MREGNLDHLAAPTDYAGRLCGIDEDVRDKPYLLVLDLKNCTGLNLECLSPSTCVSECPNENYIYKRETNTESLEMVKGKMFCTNDVNLTYITSFDQLDILISHKKCSKWYLKSQPVAERCLAFNSWEGHENETITSDELYRARKAINDMECLMHKFYTDASVAM